MAQHKSILIVDDHPLFREGLKFIIGRNERFKVVGEAENAAGALREAKKLNPDIVLVDISLPDKSGIQLTYELKKQQPQVMIMIVSMHSKIDYIAEAFQAGGRQGIGSRASSSGAGSHRKWRIFPGQLGFAAGG